MESEKQYEETRETTTVSPFVSLNLIKEPYDHFRRGLYDYRPASDVLNHNTFVL